LEKTLVEQHLELARSSGSLDPQAIAALEKKLGRQTLGALLEKWNANAPYYLSELLTEVTEGRNLLAHRLFSDPRFTTDEQRKQIILEVTSQLHSAWLLVYAHNPNNRLQPGLDWGLLEDDDDDTYSSNDAQQNSCC
jgi:hypothetical protein